MIMNHFPYKKARKCQEDTLLAIEKEWLNYDVFVEEYIEEPLEDI